MPAVRTFPRRALAPLGLAGLAACALPAETALRDWALSASVAVDRPSMLAGADHLLAQQGAVAAYLYAVSVLADPEQLLTFREEAFAPLVARAGAADPAAGAAVAEIGARLRAARSGNLPPGARANSAGQPLVEDLRFEALVRAGDAPLQVLLAGLGGPFAGAPAGADGRQAYGRLLGAVAEDHAWLAARPLRMRQRATARDMRDAESRLLRLLRALPPDPAVAVRGPAGGPVAAIVQP